MQVLPFPGPIDDVVRLDELRARLMAAIIAAPDHAVEALAAAVEDVLAGVSEAGQPPGPAARLR